MQNDCPFFFFETTRCVRCVYKQTKTPSQSCTSSIVQITFIHITGSTARGVYITIVYRHSRATLVCVYTHTKTTLM